MLPYIYTSHVEGKKRQQKHYVLLEAISFISLFVVANYLSSFQQSDTLSSLCRSFQTLGNPLSDNLYTDIT